MKAFGLWLKEKSRRPAWVACASPWDRCSDPRPLAAAFEHRHPPGWRRIGRL